MRLPHFSSWWYCAFHSVMGRRCVQVQILNSMLWFFFFTGNWAKTSRRLSKDCSSCDRMGMVWYSFDNVSSKTVSALEDFRIFICRILLSFVDLLLTVLLSRFQTAMQHWGLSAHWRSLPFFLPRYSWFRCMSGSWTCYLIWFWHATILVIILWSCWVHFMLKYTNLTSVLNCLLSLLGLVPSSLLLIFLIVLFPGYPELRFLDQHTT